MFRRVSIFLIVLSFLIFAEQRAFCASPVEEAVLELERSTSFHWGQDCLVWVVHYSQSMVDPWIEAESIRSNLSPLQKEEYRKSFIAELRMEDSEPFLVSIYSFGASPLDLKPFPEKISLIAFDGGRVKPTSYEKIFDDPIQGMVQGLVFFPKQQNKNFSVALKGTGVFAERIFDFSGGNMASAPKAPELVVIDVPPEPKPAPKPTPSPAPAPAPEPYSPPLIIEEKPKPEPEKKPEPIAEPKPSEPDPNSYVSREKVLQNFINYWISGDVSSMYDMLSDENKTIYSRSAFDVEVRKHADIKRGLLSGYKIEWAGDERAKIVTTKKLLIMRTLISKTLGVVRAGREWRIVW